MLASVEWPFSWSWHHGLRTKRLELAYRRFLPSVSEIPATFEYIDFDGPPDRLQITKIGGYPTGLGSGADGWADTRPHLMGRFGNGTRAMACRSVALPANGLQLAPRAPLTGPIRPR